MKLATLFRVLIVGDLVLSLLGMFVDFVPGMIPAELLAAFEATLEPGSLLLPVILAVVGGLLYLVAIFGLLCFASWAPMLALVVIEFRVFLAPWAGPVVQSGWADSLFLASATCSGAVLALAFFSPLKERFMNNREKNGPVRSGR